MTALVPRGGPRFGAQLSTTGVRFSAWSADATQLWVCLFDKRGAREIDRVALEPEGPGVYSVDIAGVRPGARYGLRADGPFEPAEGLWFDPDKLLVDPYAVEIDRPYVYDAALAAARGAGSDTAPLMPKAIVSRPPPPPPAAPLFKAGGLVYEVAVRAFTRLHPDIPPEQRGTIAALAHPAVLAHLGRLGVDAVELMPVTAWIDERHLGPLGLTNGWGYNPVTFMALDPRVAPGGMAELAATVASLRAAGIATILDLVFNHTGESDALGPTLSLRGLDNRSYYRHAVDHPGLLINDTGTGNTLDTRHPVVVELVLDSLRHFVTQAGVDGFRFDLAPIMGRGPDGFDSHAPLLAAIRADPLLAGRALIAEPWDIGAGGYQLGNFGAPFLEWNDRYRDDVRRFWRGDGGLVGRMATCLSGSSDLFGRADQPTTRTLNFIAAHDGMTLADLVRFDRKHNLANGEENRDGHDENFSWDNGAPADSVDPKVAAARLRDQLSLLSTLFASRGTIMLTAGDEFGRSQQGNNNAYAQDNEITWLDWAGRDRVVEAHAYALGALRRRVAALSDAAFLTGLAPGKGDPADVEWLSELGHPLAEWEWNDLGRRRLSMVLGGPAGRLAVLINGDRRGVVFTLPERPGWRWALIAAASPGASEVAGAPVVRLPGRSVAFAEEVAAAEQPESVE